MPSNGGVITAWPRCKAWPTIERAIRRGENVGCDAADRGTVERVMRR
jgi:hypothetical protein